MNHLAPRAIIVAFSLISGAGLGGTALAAEPSPLRFTDAAGQVVTLAAVPQRLVVVGDGAFMLAHLLYAFPEGRTRLVGIEKRSPVASDFLALIDSSFTTKSFLDPNPGPEHLAGLHPDLVLCRGRALDARAKALSKVGIPIAFVGTESPERYLQDIELLGTILGNPSRAAELTTYYQDRIDLIERALATLDNADRPRVLLAMALSRGGSLAVQVPARSWLQTTLVEMAGGMPVWLESAEPSAGWTVVTIEQIASWNPDRIFVVFWHSPDPVKAVADLAADRHWAALDAVKAGRLHAFPADHYGWDMPDPRWILGLLWTAKTTHPDRFAELDLEAEVDRFFSELFGMDRAAVDATIRPAIKVDLQQAVSALTP